MVRPGDPVSRYSVDVGCPRCGRCLVHKASGTPGLDTRAVAQCTRCRRYWGLVVQLTDVTAEVTYIKPQASEEAA